MTGHLGRTARGARRGPRGAFTIVELMVTMGIIVLLTMLFLGVVMRARRHARDTNCKGNLTQLWKTVNYYANANDDTLFVNLATPLRISNVVYTNQRKTGWGHLYPHYLNDHRLFYCPDDPARDPQGEEYGWRHWETEGGEVQCSYGWRGRQGLVPSEATALTLSEVERNPQKALGCDYYEPFAAPPRVHHPHHINVLRCNGAVDQVSVTPSFGPDEDDFQLALAAIDR